MDWGFKVDPSKSFTIISIFILYSIFVVVMGYMVQRSNKGLSSKSKLTNYLTGGDGVSSLGIGMLSLTAVFTGAVMIGNPGLVFAPTGGLIVALCVTTNAWGVFFMQATLGKKLSIMKKRCGVETVIQALRMRFNSKFLAGFLSITMFVFLISYMSAQYTGGAKMLAVLVGVDNYWVGIMLIGIVTVAYTATGGVKSMIRVAILQGVFMMLASMSLFFFGSAAVVAEFGSWDAVVRLVIETRPGMYIPTTYTFLQAIGYCFSVGFSCTACIHALPSTLTHNSAKTIKRGILFATIGTPMVNFFMPQMGYLAYIMNPMLQSGDLATPYVAGVLAPGAVGAIVLCGTAAAIQSSCAAFMLVAATCLVKDFYKDILKPEVTDQQATKLMPIFTILAGTIGILTALYPTQLMATVNYFANGGMICGLWAPLVFGIHSKSVTPAGAIASSISGITTYIVMYLLYTNPATAPAYKAITGNCNPNLIGLAVAIIVLLVVSKYTRKVEFGIAQAWFGKTYDPRYAKLSTYTK